MRIRTLRALAPLLLLALAPPAARAEGEPPVVRVVDLGPWRLPAHPTGPVLWIPTDGQEEDPTWVAFEPRPRPWINFTEPPFSEFPFAPDSIVELVRGIPAFSEEEGSSVEQRPGEIVVRGKAATAEAGDAAARWWMDAIAPSVRVDAVLTGGEGEEQVLASGGARLWPGRWTRLWVQEQETPLALTWGIEIAQEATAANPVVTDVPTGRELYVRYHPGEETSLLEVWSGQLDPLEVTVVDLSEIRNVPEGNALGEATFPQTGVKRAFTHLLAPAKEESTHVVRWTGPGGPARLTLRVSAAPATAEARDAGGMVRGVLRTGAYGAAVDFEARSGLTEAFVEQLRQDLPQGDDWTASTVSPDVVVFRGSAAVLAAARTLLRAREATTRAATVTVRLLAVPEPAWRRAVRDGSAGVGRRLDPAALAAFREAGQSAGWSLEAPVVLGTGAGFRTGASVVGLHDLETEVAQTAAGMAPLTVARFAGLAGNVRVEQVAGARRLVVTGFYTWADPESTKLGLVFRPPVTMGGAKQGFSEEPDMRRRASFPLLGGGRSRIEAQADVPSGSQDEVVLAATVRGAEAMLVLGAVR